MKFELPAGAFPALNLSERRRNALLDEAKRVVGETVAANEAFISAGRVLRSSDWRLVKSRENVQVYQQRSSGSNPSNSELDPPRRRGDTLQDDKMTLVEAMKRPHVPLLALHGVVEGSLHDAMYGTFADDDRSWRWRSTHVNDRFDDAKILATLARPESGDPFRFAGVKWFAKEHPAVLSSFVARRDFLIVEATGLTEDSKGAKVGYMLMHSVSLRGVPELTDLGIIRGALSFCYLIRERDGRTVELFCRGFSDPLGDMMERVSVAIATEALMAAVSVVDYANVKKLTWLAKRHKSRSRPSQTGRDAGPDQGCEVCHFQMAGSNGGANTGRVLSGLLSAVASSVGVPAQCQICHRRVCSKCSVLKKMTVDVSARSAVLKTLRFCVECVMQAKDMSAWDIATQALKKSLRQSSSSSPSSTSTSSPPSVILTPSSISARTPVMLTPKPAPVTMPTPPPLPPQPPLPRRQRSEELRSRSRVTRAYSQQIPSARFVHKANFPAPSSSRTVRHPTDGSSRTPSSSVSPTSRSKRSERESFHPREPVAYAPIQGRMTRRQTVAPPEPTPALTPGRHSERLAYHVVL